MDQADDKDWTPQRVEARLVAAFRSLPNAPVFGGGRLGFSTASGPPTPHTEALGWSARFVDDRADGLALLTWANCRATGASIRERYHYLGWKRTSAERGRRRALSRIVECLRNEQTP